MIPIGRQYLARHNMVGLERPDPEVLAELILLPNLKRHELVVEVRLVHGAVDLEEPPHKVSKAGRYKDSGWAHPPAASCGDVNG